MLLYLRPAERSSKRSANLKRKPADPRLRVENRDVFIGANLLTLATCHQKMETYCFSLFFHERLRTPLSMRLCTSLQSCTPVPPAFMSNLTCLPLQQLLWELALDKED